MTGKLRVLDLFSGIGGFSLGLERTGCFETVAFCEINPFCRAVLQKHWPDVPVFEDVRSVAYEGPVDVICGGYPCQPFSVAGERQGQADDRHLWPAMFDLIQKHRPAWVIGENVAGHISLGLDEVLAELESAHYQTTPFVLPACAVGAPHRRDRVWIVAHTDQDGQSTVSQHEEQMDANPDPVRLQGGLRWTEPGWDKPSEAVPSSETGWFQNELPEPTVRRGDDGFSGRVDRLKALGNAVVPQIPEMIGHAIVEAIR